MKKLIPMMAVCVVLFAGCTGLSDTQQRTGTGAAGGAAAGAVVGAMVGSPALGAGIGAGVGSAGGYLWDRHKKAEDKAYQEGVEAGRKSE